MAELSHLDEAGNARMVDVGSKPISRRRAVAEAHVTMGAGTREALFGGSLPKGDALFQFQDSAIEERPKTRCRWVSKTRGYFVHGPYGFFPRGSYQRLSTPSPVVSLMLVTWLSSHKTFRLPPVWKSPLDLMLCRKMPRYQLARPPPCR